MVFDSWLSGIPILEEAGWVLDRQQIRIKSGETKILPCLLGWQMRDGVEGSNFLVQSQQMCPGMSLGDSDGYEQLWLYHLSKSITQVKSGQWRMQATDV